jgi:hypothetical protein
MPPKKQDLITNIIQAQLEQAAKLLHRSDFQIAVVLRPGQRPRYAIKLGEQQWLKDIDLPSTLEIITAPKEEFLEDARDTNIEIQKLTNKQALINAHACWTVNPPMDPPI